MVAAVRLVTPTARSAVGPATRRFPLAAACTTSSSALMLLPSIPAVVSRASVVVPAAVVPVTLVRFVALTTTRSAVTVESCSEAAARLAELPPAPVARVAVALSTTSPEASTAEPTTLTTALAVVVPEAVADSVTSPPNSEVSRSATRAWAAVGLEAIAVREMSPLLPAPLVSITVPGSVRICSATTRRSAPVASSTWPVKVIVPPLAVTVKL